jgi:16S rRNA A1518/A1519 N6-dimethyltransferase RsmA/KsgA/DIM1 with predicted DNA glycosylase/AP lyase activity
VPRQNWKYYDTKDGNILFDLKTVPKVIIKEISYNDIDIVQLSYRPKTYRLLNRGNQWMMLDTYTNKEIKEMYSSYDMAYGDVIISGFGFGILACWLASKPEVTSVTVLEMSKDVYDIFLMNNKLPDKVNVIITDASEYKTDKHFDCLFLDHYEHNSTDWVFKDVKKIVNNLPNHKVLWFWSLEAKYTEVMFNITNDELMKTILWEQYIDFYVKYDEFKNNILNIKTLPELSRDKFNDYIYTYCDRLGYSTEVELINSPIKLEIL